MALLLFLVALAASAAIPAAGDGNAPDDGKRTPPMGFNTWCTNSTCGHDVCTESEVRSVAQALLDSGLASIGYTHVDLDDCWENSSRDAEGRIQADPSRFPSGMPALSAWLHARNLSFGIYTSLGVTVCNLGGHATHPPGSYGHEVSDAATFASWGADVVKGDWCDPPPNATKQALTSTMAAAIAQTGRPTWFYFHCDGSWAPWCPTLGQSSRVAPDHCDGWSGAACPLSKSKGHGTGDVIAALRTVGAHSGLQPGGEYWIADWDLLMIGGQACNDTDPHGCAGQTDVEYRTEFTFWALAGSPLLLATDPRALTPIMREVLFNTELIAVNQDPTPRAAMGVVYVRDAACGGAVPCEVWARPPGADGAHYAILFNPNALNTTPVAIAMTWADLGLAASVQADVRDLWAHRDLGSFTGAYATAADVAPHEARALKIAPHSRRQA